MASPRVQNIFLKCPKCDTVNRLVAAGISDRETVSCSHCSATIGGWGKLKLLASSFDAGASRFRDQGLRLR